MLVVLPFLVMAVAFLDGYFPGETMSRVPVKGSINIAFNYLDKSWLSVIGSLIVLGVAYLIFFINERFKLLYQTTTLPSLLYVLLTSGMLVSLGIDNLLISVFIIILAVERLQLAINDIKDNHALYDFGMLIMLSVAVYPKFVLLVVWAICVLFFSGRSTLKDITALLLGLLTPVVFLTFYYFWIGSPVSLPDSFVYNLLVGEYIHRLPVVEVVRLGMLLFLLLVALYNLSVRYSILTVNQRRGILSLVSMLIFLTVTLFLIPGNYYDFMYVIALPLSFIYSQYFLTYRTVIFGNLMFVLFLGACFLTYMV